MTLACIEQKTYTGQPTDMPERLILDANTWVPVMGDKYTSANNRFIKGDEFRWRPQYPTHAITWNAKKQILKRVDIIKGQSQWNDGYGEDKEGVHIPSPCTIAESNGPGFGLLSEGVLSNDGRYLVLCSCWKKPQQPPGRVDHFCVVDLEARRVGPMNYFAIPYSTRDYGDIDWCSISPLGNYVVLKYSSNNIPEYARCFEINPTTLAATPRVFIAGDNPILQGDNDGAIADPKSAVDYNGWMACMSHGDFQISTAATLTGTSVEVYVGGQRIYGSDITNCSTADKAALGGYIAQSMDKGKHVHVSVGTTGLSGSTEAEDQHTSGRCYMQPGYLLGTYSYHATNKLSDEMVLWPLISSSTPIRCGTTRTNDDGNYNAEAHAVPSPGCEKIMFASNWQRNAVSPGPADDIKAYVLSPLGGIPSTTGTADRVTRSYEIDTAS
jgi:hypothetical protein